MAEWQDEEIKLLEVHIAELEAERDQQHNRALKWRRQAAYYKLREARCMGEANYTSVERVDELEAERDAARQQRDMLKKAIRPFADVGAMDVTDEELENFEAKMVWPVYMLREAARALAALAAPES